jgi:hypothetical protein
MQVLKENIVLLDRRKREPQSRAQVGDVARLESGRLVARCRFQFDDGTHAYAIRDYDPGETPESAPSFVSPTDWGRYIDHEINQNPGRYRRLEPRDYDRERAEVVRFRREWPIVSKRIEEAIDLCVTAAPAALFDLGSTLWANQGVGMPDYDIDFRGFADKHAAGDWGTHGKYDPAPLTEEESWLIGSQSVAVQNRAAIAARSGAVRSQFVLFDERDGKKASDYTPGKPRLAVLEALTVLAPRGPRTLVRTGSVDV